MDPYVHTVISTGLLYVAFRIGRWKGAKDGELIFWNSLINIFKAKAIEITDDGDMIVTDMNGNEKKVN